MDYRKAGVVKRFFIRFGILYFLLIFFLPIQYTISWRILLFFSLILLLFALGFLEQRITENKIEYYSCLTLNELSETLKKYSLPKMIDKDSITLPERDKRYFDVDFTDKDGFISFDVEEIDEEVQQEGLVDKKYKTEVWVRYLKRDRHAKDVMEKLVGERILVLKE
ncbi:MAG: hypothetical protein ABH834_02825 [Candidatus Altiarchaeota archaeon]